MHKPPTIASYPDNDIRRLKLRTPENVEGYWGHETADTVFLRKQDDKQSNGSFVKKDHVENWYIIQSPYYLFLDDSRAPIDCHVHMQARKCMQSRPNVYLEKKWLTVRSMDEFIATITGRGLPMLISFDHDLERDHYCITPDSWMQNEDIYTNTGYHCAKWLCEYCRLNKLPMPRWIVHSCSPSKDRIYKYLLDHGRHYKWI